MNKDNRLIAYQIAKKQAAGEELPAELKLLQQKAMMCYVAMQLTIELMDGIKDFSILYSKDLKRVMNHAQQMLERKANTIARERSDDDKETYAGFALSKPLTSAT